MSKNNKLMGIITPSASNKKGLTHYRIIPSLAIYQIEGTNTLICGLSLPCPLLFTRIVTSKVAVLTAIQTTPMFYVGGWACYKGPSQTTPSTYGRSIKHSNSRHQPKNNNNNENKKNNREI